MNGWQGSIPSAVGGRPRGESEQKPLELWGNMVASRASDRFRERSCSSLAPGFLRSPNAGVGAEAAHYELPEPPKRKGIPSNTLSLAGGGITCRIRFQPFLKTK